MMFSLRTTVVVSSLVLVLACRREIPSTATADATSTSAPTATVASATTSTAPPEQYPACYPAMTPGGPSVLPAVALSGNIPLFVPLPAVINSPVQIRPYFDWFSWAEFIALNWPASTTGRGNPQSPNDPNVLKNPPANSQTVWSTYKANWELFDQGTARPTPFDSYDVPVAPTCGTSTVPGAGKKKTLVMTSKGTSVLNDGVQAFSFPLVDNKKEYLMYEVRYARQPYEFMRGADTNNKSWLYLAKNLVGVNQVDMPPTQSIQGGVSKVDQLGSIMIKAAWRDMTAVPQDQWSRYYVVKADVFDPATQKCADTSVGLVGLHIVQKLDQFPEWVWSTFEQVDVLAANQQNTLLPACPPNDPACTANGFKNRPTSTNLNPDQQARVPVQVLRTNPIPTTPAGGSTVDANAAFQAALAGTPWANYQLVVTQWPFAANDPTAFKGFNNGGNYPCTSGLPFPVNGAVNLTMETYFQTVNSAQGSGGNSCISCHFRTSKTDFSWGLNRRPH
jgi:hypothetical protein